MGPVCGGAGRAGGTGGDTLCATLMLEAVMGGLCLLQVLEVMRCMLEVTEVMRGVLLCMLEALCVSFEISDVAVFSLQSATILP